MPLSTPYNPETPIVSSVNIRKNQIVLLHDYSLNVSVSQTVDYHISGFNSITLGKLKVTNYLQQKLGSLIFEDPEGILEYIFLNQEIIEPLVKCENIIKSIFGQKTDITLSIFHDPEEDKKILNVFIANDHSSEIAIQKEIEIYEGWFLRDYGHLTHKINFREIPV
jgi:hypothetical protein